MNFNLGHCLRRQSKSATCFAPSHFCRRCCPQRLFPPLGLHLRDRILLYELIIPLKGIGIAAPSLPSFTPHSATAS